MFGKKFRNRTKPIMVLILGFGESGYSIAQWCIKNGCKLRIADTREVPPNFFFIKNNFMNVDFIHGKFSISLLNDIDLIGISPGISSYDKNLIAITNKANNLKIPIWGEIEFFSQAIKNLKKIINYNPKIIAITGTNGKTTTTILTTLICIKSGKKISTAGNIGPSILNSLNKLINYKNLPEIWILELSSFQLERSITFTPNVAVILNITEDHIDWHKNFSSYIAAKNRIFKKKTICLLNRDDNKVISLQFTNNNIKKFITFGLNEPCKSGDYGVKFEKNILWIVRAYKNMSKLINSKNKDLNTKINFKRLLSIDSLKTYGYHNISNTIAACALANLIGIKNNLSFQELFKKKLYNHRIELIGSFKGIDYINDSKSTNVGSLTAALNSIGRPTVLIAGGDGKGQNFNLLNKPVAKWCRAVILIGKSKEKIHLALINTKVKIIEERTLEKATETASKIAQSGDVILLSPACASFDMFKNYKERAEIFQKTVKQIIFQEKNKI